MTIKRWQFIFGVGLLLVASVASALSLGRVRGTPLLGRALDVSVQATLEAQEAVPEAACFYIELFFGESRVSANAISISPERTSSGDVRVRIRTTSVVDEPVVTLFLRTSCGPPLSRRYVLLAEALTDAEGAVVQPPPVPTVPAAVAKPASAPRAPTPTVATPTTPDADLARAERAAQRDAQRQARREAAAAKAAERRASGAEQESAREPVRIKPSRSLAAAEPAKKAKPRLQLDLLDLSTLEPQLRGSFELSTEPATDAAVRAQAMALWRSLSASPEDALRDVQRLETLEKQMRESLEQSKRQAQDIASLSAQLQDAQRERYFNPFTYFLALLALLALGLSVWLWRRQSDTDRPWWRGAGSSQPEEREEQHWKHLNDEMMQDVDVGLVDQAKPKDSSGAHLGKAKSDLVGRGASSSSTLKASSDRNSDLVGLKSKASLGTSSQKQDARAVAGMGRFEVTKPPGLQIAAISDSNDARLAVGSLGYSDFGSSSFSSSRLVSTEELFDIQEQADFFMSLDQPDQAIAVLKNHITDNVETSALAYMDLFDIYHRTGRKDEYQALREEFNRVFNAQAPEFSHHADQSLGLEEYPHAIQALERAWPRPLEALELIEEYIFRQPDPQQLPFDMLAYRELMLLYAMTKDLVKTHDVKSMLPTIAALKQAIAGSDAVTESELDLGAELDYFVSSQSNDPVHAAVNPSDAEEGLNFEPVELPVAATWPKNTKVLPTLDFDLSDVGAIEQHDSSPPKTFPYR